MGKLVPTTSWKAFLKTLPHYPVAPAGWLSLTEYTARSCSSVQGVKRSVENGQIPSEHCAKVGPRNLLHIAWDATAYAFILRKREQYWPADFTVNTSEEYKPLAVKPTALRTKKEEPKPAAGLHLKKVTDINSAKYRTEQLKIMKMEGELSLAKNETVPLKEVVATLREIGLETKVALKRAITIMCPKMVTVKNVLACRAILETHLYDALEHLKLDGTEIHGSRTSKKTTARTPKRT